MIVIALCSKSLNIVQLYIMYYNSHVCTVTWYSFSCYSVLNESGANSRTGHAHPTAQTLHQNKQRKVGTL